MGLFQMALKIGTIKLSPPRIEVSTYTLIHGVGAVFREIGEPLPLAVGIFGFEIGLI